MLQLKLGTSWRANRDRVLDCLAEDVRRERAGAVLLVPEQISHDYERRLCQAAGDRASRYGEVLSFTRLASRVFSLTGGGAAQTLDSGGRLLAMAAAVQQLRPRLKAYASVGSKPEFLSALVTAVDEFKSCCITAQTLRETSVHTEGALAQKVEELSLLLEGYDAVCSGFGQDPRDRMTHLLEHLEESDFAREHHFYIDGFSDFTAQEMAILAHLLENAPQVTVSLVCDRENTDRAGMELAGETAAALVRMAARAGTEAFVERLSDPEAAGVMGCLRRSILSGPVDRIPELELRADALRLRSPWEECCFAAGQIRLLASRGVRYRDMSVVLAQPGNYAPVLRGLLRQYGIPAYFAGAEDILHKSVVYTVLTALEAVVEGLDRENVLRYLKSVLSTLKPEECDELENYAIAWRIRGRAWAEPFTRNPRGLVDEDTEEDARTLAKLEEYRRQGVGPLLELEQAMRRGTTALEKLRGLYDFLERVKLTDRLEELTAHFEAQGDARSAREQEQLWDILVSAMEQMAALLGETVLDMDQFLRLFRLLLSQYTVGTIPQMLDSVTVGGIPAMRRQEAEYVFVLGAAEGFMPAGGKGGMVLTEQERKSLMDLGVPLRADLYRQLQQEQAGILAVVSGAANSLFMTVSGNEPAYCFRRLCRMLDRNADDERTIPNLHGLPDAWAAGAMYLRVGAEAPGDLTDTLSRLDALKSHRLGKLSPETIRGLYRDNISLSATKIDRLADCRFAYFMDYGLGLKERKEITVDPAEFGTFVHDVLERTVNKVNENGGFHQVSLEKTMEYAMELADEYQHKHFSALEGTSSRLDYLFRRNLQELRCVVQELWNELSQSAFEPYLCELEFGGKGRMEAVQIRGGAIPAQIRGKVDRVDIYRRDGRVYVRVVDYKTGKKAFDYCDVLNGLGLQMLIYLFALEDGGQNLLEGKPEAAGVLYFPARSGFPIETGPEELEEARKEHYAEMRRKGLLLDDAGILEAMDPEEGQPILPDRKEYLATNRDFERLKTYVMRTLARLVDTIAEGTVDPNPYETGDHSACRYCPYPAACHLELWGEKRLRKKVRRASFWETVEREVENHG